MAEHRNPVAGAPALFEAGEAAAVAGGACRGALGARILSVAADSREVRPGALFVALKGERVDGHDFIRAALDSGASCVFAASSRSEEAAAAFRASPAGSGACLVLVDSPLAALQALAREYRKRMKDLFRIGVTGSSGKTTTKECIAAILRETSPGAVAVNPGNLNSDVGLALSLFGVDSGHRLGVFEMGMNRIGEMEELASMYEPDLALVTNVGTAHIGIIGSRDGIAAEKKAVFSRFDGRQRGFVWDGDDYRNFLKEGVRGAMAEFGLASTAGLESAQDAGLSGWRIAWKGESIDFRLVGRHNLLDGLAALSVADALGADPRAVARGLGTTQPLFGRSEIVEGEVTLVRDCYNANPDSVESALEFCDAVSWKGRKVYVLGSMLELGDTSAAEHRAMGTRAASSGADALFFFGEECRNAFDAARERGFRGTLRHADDIGILGREVISFLRPGDLVLLKASRGLALERLAKEMEKAGLCGADDGGTTHAS